MIEGKHILCEFPDGQGRRLRALDLPSLSLPDGAACALTGPSGSGKSTLFHCLSGILRPTAGQICIDGTDITAMGDSALAAWRAQRVGYIFQQALLLPYLTVKENILLAAAMARRERSEAEREAADWLARTGLASMGERLPAHLSGGEKQRVGFIRAVITRPALLLADEPTASLDGENSRRIMDALLDYQGETGCTLLCATHDPAVRDRFSMEIHLSKGGST